MRRSIRRFSDGLDNGAELMAITRRTPVAPATLAAVGTALAEHPEIAWAAATTGTTNLAASAVCRDLDALYEYLTGRVGNLEGVQQVETAPVIRVIKRAGAVVPG